MDVRRYRGSAPYNLYWPASLSGLGGEMFFVRRSNESRRGTSMLTNEYVPKQEDNFFIENEVKDVYAMAIYIQLVVNFIIIIIVHYIYAWYRH